MSAADDFFVIDDICLLLDKTRITPAERRIVPIIVQVIVVSWVGT